MGGASAATAAEGVGPRISALYCYPLKSGRGRRLAQARLDTWGLEGDRAWMVVDGEGGFLSQRSLPAMALIEALPRPGGLVLEAPGMAPLAVPVPAGDALREVEVWGDAGVARDAGDAAAAWLEGFLGQACRLVALGPEWRRPVDPDHDPYGSQAAFSDGFPLLLISEASLADLNARLPAPLPMSRFRPNIVLDSCAPYAEDGWRSLDIGGLRLEVVKPCSRCAITTVDTDTGRAGKEPLRTLARYRRGAGGKVYFGQNLVHGQARGVLRVGDVVTVLD